MINDSGRLIVDCIDTPPGPTGIRGRIGMCACPGGRRFQAPDFDPRRDIERDLVDISALAPSGVVSLIQFDEMDMLGIHELPELLQAQGIWWMHLPIVDMGVPDKVFEREWSTAGDQLRTRLGAGETIVLHCLAGLGRTGTIAARLLIEMGMEPEAAILRVRSNRSGAIQTRKQERHVLKIKPVG